MRVLSHRHTLSTDGLVERDLPLPFPGPRELLVRIDAVSLNFRDVAIARGDYPDLQPTFIPGSDGAGEVVATGADVTRFQVGARVCLAYVVDWIEGPVDARVAARRLGGPDDGVLAEYVVVPEHAAVHAPRHLSAIEAATLPVAAVATYQALVTDGGLRAGEVLGITGVSAATIVAIQIARARGAEVIVVGRDPEKLERLRELGAIPLPAQGAWEHEVLARTAGRGADLFFDVVGGESLPRAVAATRVGGSVSVFGFAGGTTSRLDLLPLIRRSITLRPTSGGSRASFEALVRLLEEHAIHPVVARVVPFSLPEVRDALDELARGRSFGKVVVRMGAA